MLPTRELSLDTLDASILVGDYNQRGVRPFFFSAGTACVLRSVNVIAIVGRIGIA